ncbi:MBL fold metallo-hydrolase [Halobacterium bonnevillei]|uniref:MBL fold metallo-hydrolase n=1 Tax=Halobacterium bonnevillei TaxID=2692200 RepID=A0A6B0SPJ5_9EURY|nr:MBL fold metallo-hydrolase [Halobacterium bonnevillei]MXR19549.1 MBL fold metallo-hydrolase [Halobacterium bonnevillei]
MTVRQGGVTVDWLGYATTRIEWPDATVAYTDPGRYGVLTGEWTPGAFDTAAAHPAARDYRAEDADLVVVTHDHHYDPDGIERVAAADASVVVYEAVDAANISRDVAPVDELDYDVVRVAYGDKLTAAGVDLSVLPAETVPDEPGGTSSHPPGFGCGFVLTRGGRSAFWPGDTDPLDAHEALAPDVFLPPISAGITMTESEAATLAATLAPDLVVPIHYNTFAGLAADEDAFVAAVARRGIPVAVDSRTG